MIEFSILRQGHIGDLGLCLPAALYHFPGEAYAAVFAGPKTPHHNMLWRAFDNPQSAF